MPARDEQVRRPHLGPRDGGGGGSEGGGEVELQRQTREDVQDVRVRRRDARGVEERGHGAVGDGDGGGVGRVAGVVLRAAAYGHVLHYQAC